MPPRLGRGDPAQAGRDIWRLWDAHIALHETTGIDYQRDRAEHQAAHDRDQASLNMRLLEHSAAHDREHLQGQQAINKAEKATEDRFHAVNESRQTLTDQAATFARAETIEARYSALATQLSTMERNLNDKRDVQGAELGKRITALETYQSSSLGRGSGASQAFVWIFAAISALGATITIIILIATHL